MPAGAALYWADKVYPDKHNSTRDKVGYDIWVPAVCGVANIFATANFLSFLRPYEHFGYQIKMLTQILSDIRFFLYIQLLFIIGFAMAFAIMLPAQSKFQLPMAMLTAYEMMLGGWHIDDFEAEGPAHDGPNILTTLSTIS